MARVRAALFLDFDNVFSGLFKSDPQAALDFARNPDVWLGRLVHALTVEGPRRWLVLRCYMNPAGSVSDASSGKDSPRQYFSQFRPSFTQAGFEVVDCPRLTYTKNAADIRMALDAMDALSAQPAYDEFVIASGDADMTPLLVRLRAADRRTTIISPSDAASAFTSIADRLIDAAGVLRLIQGDDDDEETPEEPSQADQSRAKETLSRRTRERYLESSAPINLAALAAELQNGDSADASVIRQSRWFGHGSFGRFLGALNLPHMSVSQHYLWDASRHTPPDDAPLPAAPAAGAGLGSEFPDAVERMTKLLSLPRLPRGSWTPVYEVLADYASGHPFNLSEATKWGRDTLAARGFAIGRSAVGAVMNASAHGDCPLYRDPPPTADEIARAVVSNVLRRAELLDTEFDEVDSMVVRTWLGDPDMSPTRR